jgi:hypothetical protein
MHSDALAVDAPRRVELAKVTELASVALVVIAGVIARCWQINWNFDPDEVFSIRLATAPFSDMILGAMRDAAGWRTGPPWPPSHCWHSVRCSCSTASRRVRTH